MIPAGREGGGGSPISMILGLENTQNGDSLKKADSNGLWWRLQKPKSSDALSPPKNGGLVGSPIKLLAKPETGCRAKKG